MRLVNDRVVQEGEEVAFLRSARLVAIKENVSYHSDFRSVAARAAAAHGARGIRRRAVPMNVEEDISLDPRIRTIEVPAVVIAARHHVADELHNRLPEIAVAADCAVHHVVIAHWFAKKIAEKNPLPAALHT